MRDLFHESRVAYESANIIYTSVGSLTGTAVYSTVQACENALQALWHTVLGPNSHTVSLNYKPAQNVKNVGLYPYYSEKTQIFIDKQIEWNLQDVRFEHRRAYEEYTKPESHRSSKFILEGTKGFIDETEAMKSNPEVINIINRYRK